MFIVVGFSNPPKLLLHCDPRCMDGKLNPEGNPCCCVLPIKVIGKGAVSTWWRDSSESELAVTGCVNMEFAVIG